MFPYKRATIDYGFESINDIESINLNSVIGCFLMGAWFLGHGGMVLGCGGMVLGHGRKLQFSCPKQLSLKIKFIV